MIFWQQWISNPRPLVPPQAWDEGGCATKWATLSQFILQIINHQASYFTMHSWEFSDHLYNVWALMTEFVTCNSIFFQRISRHLTWLYYFCSMKKNTRMREKTQKVRKFQKEVVVSSIIQKKNHTKFPNFCPM